MPNRIDSVEAFRGFADLAAVYIYVVDDETDELLIANNHYAENLGVPASRIEGHKCWEFVMGEGRCPFCPRDLDLDGEGGFDPGPCSASAFNPTLGIWGKWTSQRILWTNGHKAYIMMIIDTSEEKLLREELSKLAYYDKRMGIPNRAKIEKDIEDRAEGNFCMIAFDYISLRYINDAYGRPIVNALFDVVINWIRSFDLQYCEVYHIDSDEFCLLLDNADMLSASGLADRLYERFREPWEIKIGGGVSTISCRIALCVIDGRFGFKSTEDILSIVDRMLEFSKETKAIAVYDKNLDAILKRDLALEISLKSSVQADMNSFDVYFQPIVDPNKERWVGLEALCRWDSPEFGRIPPRVFIHIAEQIGLINKIGYWVLDTAIGICSRLGLDRVEDFFLDVNLSPSQMNDETLINKVLVSLQRYNFPAHCLSLEVTESQDLISLGYSHTTIERLKSLDIKVALDDFGTGYSNFNNLRNLPVRILKTGKQFIDNIATDDYQKFLTKSIVDLAHEANMTLVAEGVETFEQMKVLLKNKADYFQGYLFAMPLTVAELTESVYKFSEPDVIFSKAKAELSATEEEKFPA